MDMVEKIKTNTGFWLKTLTLGILSIGLWKLVDEGYAISVFNLILGAFLLGVSVFKSQHQRKSFRYLPLLILSLLCNLFVKSGSLQFLTVLLLFLFSWEALFHKLNSLLLIGWLICSPIFVAVINSFTFGIRLKLSELAGYILSLLNENVLVSGNEIIVDGINFSVESACMGLNMVESTLLFAIILLVYFWGNKLPIFKSLGLIVIAFGLTVLTNLLRIVFLVQFEILPENPLHEGIGLLILIIYAWLPLWWLVNKTKPAQRSQELLLDQKNRKALALVFALTIVSTFIIIQNPAKNGVTTYFSKEISGYSSKHIDFGITQYANSKALVYVKPLKNFFAADHSPQICWRGSGYHFTKVEERIVNGKTLYFAQIENKKSILYTTWWYASENELTNSQLELRWKMFKFNKVYYLVNLTCSTEQELAEQLYSWIGFI